MSEYNQSVEGQAKPAIPNNKICPPELTQGNILKIEKMSKENQSIVQAVIRAGGFQEVSHKGRKGQWTALARFPLKVCSHRKGETCSCGKILKKKFLTICRTHGLDIDGIPQMLNNVTHRMEKLGVGYFQMLNNLYAKGRPNGSSYTSVLEQQQQDSNGILQFKVLFGIRKIEIEIKSGHTYQIHIPFDHIKKISYVENSCSFIVNINEPPSFWCKEDSTNDNSNDNDMNGGDPNYNSQANITVNNKLNGLDAAVSNAASSFYNKYQRSTDASQQQPSHQAPPSYSKINHQGSSVKKNLNNSNYDSKSISNRDAHKIITNFFEKVVQTQANNNNGSSKSRQQQTNNQEKIEDNNTDRQHVPKESTNDSFNLSDITTTTTTMPLKFSLLERKTIFKRCRDFSSGQASCFRTYVLSFSNLEIMQTLINIVSSISTIAVIETVSNIKTVNFLDMFEYVLPTCEHQCRRFALLHCLDCDALICHQCSYLVHNVEGSNGKKHQFVYITEPQSSKGYVRKERKSTIGRCRCGTSGRATTQKNLSCFCTTKRCPCRAVGRDCINCKCKRCANGNSKHGPNDKDDVDPNSTQFLNRAKENRKRKRNKSGAKMTRIASNKINSGIFSNAIVNHCHL